MVFKKLNSGEHIDDIIGRTVCAKHLAARGAPCWTVQYDSRKGESGPGVCNTRIKNAGFNGKIHPSSLARVSRDSEFQRRR